MAHRATTSASFASGTSNTVGKPSGAVSGDAMAFFIVVDTATVSASAPSGGGAAWSTLTGTFFATNGDGEAATLFYKLANGSEPASYTLNPGTGSPQTAICTAYSGVDATGPLDGAVGTATSVNNPNAATPPSSPVTITWNSITTASASADVLMFAMVDWNSASAAAFTDPASTTRRGVETPANFSNALLVDYTQVATGATGSKTGTGTLSGQSGNFIAMMLAWKPTAAGGNAYSSTSTGTLTGSGASQAADAFSAAETATLTGSGKSLASTQFSMAGAATLTGVGASQAKGDYSSASVATVTGDAKSTAAVAFSSAEVATLTGDAASRAAADFSTAGVATLVGDSNASGGTTVLGNGSITASLTLSASGASIAAAEFSAPGAATLTGTAASLVAANGNIVIAGTLTGASQSAATRRRQEGRRVKEDDFLMELAQDLVPLLHAGYFNQPGA